MNLLDSPAYISDMEEVIYDNIPWEKIDGSLILITGANGLIASFLVDCLMYRNKLLKADITVYALCRSETKAKKRFSPYLGNDLFNLIVSDVCETPDFNIMFDYIIHAASFAHPVAFSKYPTQVIKTNIVGTMNYLDYAVRHTPKKFMFISSSEVYGINDSGEGKALKEDYSGYIDVSNPRSAYPESKRAGEALCSAYLSEYGINTVCVRPWYIYGAPMTEESSKADAQFLRNAVMNQDIIMKTAGKQLRSYCYISDCVRALLYILINGENGAYNIAGTDTVTIRQFAEICANESGVSIVYEKPDIVEEKGYSLAPNGVCSAERVGRAGRAGYCPAISTQEGIRRTIDILRFDDGKNSPALYWHTE